MLPQMVSQCGFAAMKAAPALCGALSAVATQVPRVVAPATALSTPVATPLVFSRGFAAQTMGAPSEKGKTFDQGYVAPHPGLAGRLDGQNQHVESFIPKLASYTDEYVKSIKPTHLPPSSFGDRFALAFVGLLRKIWDTTTGYGPNMTEKKWVQRIIFLESVAGIPGMVAGMLRHLKSLRSMRRDRGWIHVLLEEAENERMHLVTFMEIKKTGFLFRTAVLLAQGLIFNLYFVLYLLWPKMCHSFVGYVEEEAVRTFTHLCHDIEAGKLWKDRMAPEVGQVYWRLPKGTMHELFLHVRADEACHSFVNHTLAKLKEDEPNPFAMGKSQLP